MIKLKSYVGQIIIQLKAEEQLFNDPKWQLEKIKSQRDEIKYTSKIRYKNLQNERTWSLFHPKIKILDQLIDQKIDELRSWGNPKDILKEVNELQREQNQLMRMELGI